MKTQATYKEFFKINVNGQTIATFEQHSEVAPTLIKAIRANGLENVSWCSVLQKILFNVVMDETTIDGQMPTQEEVDEYQ